MDDFESDLSRMMRETPDVVAFEPEQRKHLRARIRSRRRGRAALMLGGSVMALAGIGFGLLALPGAFPTRSEVASAPSASAPATGRDGYLTVPGDVSPETRNAYLMENAMASCMREQGFVYTPHVQEWQDLAAAVDGADYAAAKAFRGKYGFGFYSGAVYPDDPKAPGSKASEPAPSAQSAYVNSLGPAQRSAYDKALMGTPRMVAGRKKLGGCMARTQEQVYGPEKSAAELEQESTERKAKDQASAQALNDDPQLATLAKSYASCLRREGITVSTTQPTRIGDAVKFDLATNLPPDGVTKVSRRTAQSMLDKEIHVALTDLECGKEFRAAYFPKLKEHPRYPG
ncbi:hypothetical protein [Actinopolymorpha pittospori]|uniref:Uncharacterized protein n=3 Tax=Actinopolymorpha pittospori TaxID=648752 RepID=A0A927MTB0_9ACTN|nr:hypothetical protein [Actinopolymorpha pittospori]MBE1605932.1 hypothetical protein [Actinopolymorpha pittospori]